MTDTTDDAALREATLAYYETSSKAAREDFGVSPPPFDELSPDQQERARDNARAAIKAYLAARDDAHREPLQEGRDHLTVSGTFQSDRYPSVPAGKVPLSVRDPLAQDLLWEYARRHREVAKHGDSEFPRDLEDALRNAGFEPAARGDARLAERARTLDDVAFLAEHNGHATFADFLRHKAVAIRSGEEP